MATKRRRRRILEEWESFRATALSPDCPLEQVAAMQVAFYGGAGGASNLIMDVKSIDIDTHTEILLDLQAELRDYFQAFAAAQSRASRASRSTH